MMPNLLLQGSLDLSLYSGERTSGRGEVGEKDKTGAPGKECGLASLWQLFLSIS